MKTAPVKLTLAQIARSGFFFCLGRCNRPTELKDTDTVEQRCAVCSGRVKWIPAALPGGASAAPEPPLPRRLPLVSRKILP